MAPRSLFVVINPAAGKGAAVRAHGLLREELRRAGVEHRIAETAGRGHATELAAEAAREGWGAVIAAGGDGTVNETVNGVMRAAGEGAAVPFGIVPVGSGNDFARLAGAPADPREALRRVLAAAEPRPVDVGRVGDRWFTNGVGIGLDARVAIEASRTRRLRGMGMYLYALARVLRSYRPPRMRVELDGALVLDQPMTLVTVGNGARHGGGFWICPDARIDDGLLDVCTCDALPVSGILRFLPKVMRGTHVGASCVRMLRGSRIRVTSPDPLPVHADGEIIAEAAHALDIEVQAGRLPLLG